VGDFITEIRKATLRAYQNPWTAALILFELVGAVLVGRHSRTTSLWPFLLWIGLAPWVRLLYLRELHRAVPFSLGRLARTAYGIAGWLLVGALSLLILCGALFFAVGHIRELVRFLGAYTGVWGIIFATLLLAALLALALAALSIWAGLSTVAYTRAAVNPHGSASDAIRWGLRFVVAKTLPIVGITGLQTLFVLGAVGAQLLKHSGIALMPMVWPAVLFAPVALSLLLALTESARVSSRPVTVPFYGEEK